MRRFLTTAVVAFIVLGLFGGCSGRSGGSEAEPPEDTGRVPAPLVTIEAQAEDIIDVVPAGKWTKVAADIEKTMSAWNAYKPAATRDGAAGSVVARFDAALAALRSASADHQAGPTMQAANDLSDVVVDLFGLYHPPVPTAVSRFDVIGRQIILDVDRQDLVGAGTEIERITSVWSSLKSDIVARHGGRVVTQTDGLLAAMRDAHQHADTTTLRAKTADFLEAVDRMEEVYEKAR